MTKQEKKWVVLVKNQVATQAMTREQTGGEYQLPSTVEAIEVDDFHEALSVLTERGIKLARSSQWKLMIDDLPGRYERMAAEETLATSDIWCS